MKLASGNSSFLLTSASCFGAPFTTLFQTVTLGEVSTLAAEMEMRLQRWQTTLPAKTGFTELWDFAENRIRNSQLDASTKAAKQATLEGARISCGAKLAWVPELVESDLPSWTLASQGALQEWRAIAHEYLPGGEFHVVPPSFASLPASNIAVERLFGKWKDRDTRADHVSPLLQSKLRLIKDVMDTIGMEPFRNGWSEQELQQLRGRARQRQRQREVEVDLLAKEREDREKLSRKRKRGT